MVKSESHVCIRPKKEKKKNSNNNIKAHNQKNYNNKP